MGFRIFDVFAVGLVLTFGEIHGQDTISYTGNTLVNVDYHHGQLSPAIGVHNIQTLRVKRDNRETGFGWTYNHACLLE